MPLKPIQFGTSGWRGIIADDFTFAGVRAVSAAIAEYLKRASSSKPSVVIGFDPRFLSDRFAAEATAVLTSQGVRCFVCDNPAPTPALSHEIRRRGAGGGINFTASHNPAEYNGLKFSTADGAPAPKTVTEEIERLTNVYLERGVSAPKGNPSLVEAIDPAPAYLETLASSINLAAIRDARMQLAFDALHGVAAGYLNLLLEEHDIPVASLHTERDVLFGGHPPEPSDDNLGQLKKLVTGTGSAAGLACDGDADRFGIVDSDGSFVSANHVIALLADYLLETRRDWPRALARSVATTHMIDAVAAHHKAEVHETPVGFKYIGAMIGNDEITLGGEESAGLTIFGHVPEKDGILACLLVAEMIAVRGASLRDQLEELFQRVGSYYPVRVNLHLDPERKSAALKKIARNPSSFDGNRVRSVDRTDGLKLLLDGGNKDEAWVLMRPSGTEPVVRCYCESSSPEQTAALAESARRFLLGQPKKTE